MQHACVKASTFIVTYITIAYKPLKKSIYIDGNTKHEIIFFQKYDKYLQGG